MSQVHELLAILKNMTLNLVGVAANFVRRRVHPCKERVHPAYEWVGASDPTREVTEHISASESTIRLKELFDKGTSIDNRG
jgi:hypothetical protein